MPENKLINSEVPIYAIGKSSVLFLILFSILFLIFIPVFVSSDEIRSDGKMAIGTVNISCQGKSGLHREGFCDKIFREVISGNDSIELQLFDITPNHTFCKIDCHINGAEIYDLRGNRLNLTIIPDDLGISGKSVKSKELQGYEFSYLVHSFIFILLLLSLILLFFKLRRRMIHKMKKNKKKIHIF